MASRKRTRSVAFETSESVEETTSPITKITGELELEEKGGEVWDAFREEYYEVLEQLPLTLHRSFTLMRELDDQSTEHKQELLQTLLRYIEFRKTLPHPDVLVPKEEDLSPVHRQAPISQLPKSLPQSQQILPRIAWLAEEVVRASDEKVNVAKTAYESADRQIRFLDFAIQEQETSLTLGLRPGTKPLHTLYGSTVNRYIRPPLEGAPEQNAEEEDTPNLGVVDLEGFGSEPVLKVARRGKKGRRGKKNMAQDQNASLKVTVPPLTSAVGPDPAIAADPNEPRYCYCNQVSFGEMIACDNEKCEIEWFHFGCAGITTLPEGKWYCRDCQASIKKPRGRRGR